LIFKYEYVLQVDVGWLDKLARAKYRQTLPTAITVDEVREVLNNMIGSVKSMVELIYGTGLRVNECFQRCIKD
jgi:site-specific recombinase XerD